MSEEILSELQLLTSMYSPSDIHFDDPEIVLKLDNSIPIPGSVSLWVKINEFLKLSLRIPSGYPSEERLSASCQILNKASASSSSSVSSSESRINGELQEYLKTQSASISILDLISWCNEQSQSEISISEELSQKLDLNATGDSLETTSTLLTSSLASDEKICRIWIHSHHIYNEKKRKFIVDNASSLDLSGFSLPGKPGFICVEGDAKNCDEFWSRVRQLTWQKISLIERHVLEKEKEEKAFDGFQELLIDKSSFMKYLTEKNVQSVIKDYLGF